MMTHDLPQPMDRENILLFGASGHAKVIIDIVEQQGLYRIVGLVDTYKRPGTALMGYEVLAPEECIRPLIVKFCVTAGIVAIGDNWNRHQVVQRIASIVPNFSFVNAIHPSARISHDVKLGNGIAVMAGATINPGSQIGDFCFVNTNASVDHDSILEPFSCLQPNAATGGDVRIGAFSAVSMGANVIQGISIGEHTIIGAGSTVLDNIPDMVVAYGTPCRVIRPRQPNRK
jgi:sugar O-acyltransferase (sialic acid O-acetyltransferase NeuD family)